MLLRSHTPSLQAHAGHSSRTPHVAPTPLLPPLRSSLHLPTAAHLLPAQQQASPAACRSLSSHVEQSGRSRAGVLPPCRATTVEAPTSTQKVWVFGSKNSQGDASMKGLVSVHAGNGYSGYDGGKYPQVPPASGTWGEEQQQQQPYPPYPQPPQQDQGRRNPYLGMSEQEAYDQELLHKSSVTTKNLSFVAFWLQFALSVVSAGILLFSVAFVSRGYNTTSAVDASKYLTLVGVIAAFISSLMAHGFLTMSRRVQEGKTVAKNYLVNSLLTNNAISLAGIGITVIGLQVSVGTLVAKSLATSVSGQFAAQNANQLVSLDVFALQASTNTLLCHVIGLLFTNLMLRIVNKPRKEPKPA